VLDGCAIGQCLQCMIECRSGAEAWGTSIGIILLWRGFIFSRERWLDHISAWRVRNLEGAHGLSVFLSNKEVWFEYWWVDIFKFDLNYMVNEQKYKAIMTELWGWRTSKTKKTKIGRRTMNRRMTKIRDGNYLSSILLTALTVAETTKGIKDRTETNLISFRIESAGGLEYQDWCKKRQVSYLYSILSPINLWFVRIYE
jgi:hypothetical protein